MLCGQLVQKNMLTESLWHPQVNIEMDSHHPCDSATAQVNLDGDMARPNSNVRTVTIGEGHGSEEEVNEVDHMDSISIIQPRSWTRLWCACVGECVGVWVCVFVGVLVLMWDIAP